MKKSRALPLVSVIIPTRDRITVFSQALQSVGEQSYPLIEIIVIDDFSNESISSVIQDFQNKYPLISVITHRNSSALGGGYSRYYGTKLANGDLICFLDDDDQYLQDKISILEDYLHKNQQVDAVFGRVIIRTKDKKDNLIDYTNYMDRLSNTKDIVKLQTNGSLVRKTSFKHANFNIDLKKFQDTQFHLELCRTCNVHLIKEPVAIWHKNYSKNQVSHISPDNSKAVLTHFNSLREYLLSNNIINIEDKKFLQNQKFKYIAKLAQFNDFINALRYETFFSRLVIIIYRIYYFFRSIYNFKS